MSDLDFEVKRLIKQAISAVSDAKVTACARNGREAIEKQ
jgi:hypothetical protein